MDKRVNFQKKTKCNSEKRVLTCRVLDCKQELLAKNYRQHLLSRHPTENPQDLSPFGQSKLLSFLSSSPNIDNTIEQVEQPESTTQKRCGAEVELTEQPIEKASKSFLHDVNVRGSMYINSEDEVKETDDSQKLNIIMTELQEVKNNLALLVTAQEKSSKCDDSTKTKAVPQNEKFDEDMDTLLAKVTLARSMVELESTGFLYDSNKNELRCSVCAVPQSTPEEDLASIHTGSLTGIFAYDQKTGLLFSDEDNLPEEFRNLKKHLKRHIKKSKTHISNVMEEINKRRKAVKRRGNNYEAGMNLGRACMKLYLKGRPYTDYEHDVLNLKQAKAKIGHLNHSRNFPALFRPHVYTVVKRKLKSFINEKLKQTGHKPPLALSADKATYKHRSRQFLSGVTISPGAENLLAVISFGQPVVRDGSDGRALAENMKNGLDDFGVASCQVESAVFDGVYFHCSIEKHFNSLYKLKDGEILYSHDALHKGGLVDTHMCKKPQFQWVADITQVCQQLFNLFNWGANYENLVKATTLWKLHLRNLVGFSETRFANSRRQVYVNILHEFPAIVSCLEEQITNGVIPTSNARSREKAVKARELKGKILNVDFLLVLSGLADVYSQFGVVVNISQLVHLLPHERYERFMKAVDHFQSMGQSLCDHRKCELLAPEGADQKCLWPIYHKSKETLQERNEIGNIPIFMQYGVQSAGLQSETRRQSANARSNNRDAEENADKKIQSLVEEIHQGLKFEVYDQETISVIEATKTVLDLPAIANMLHAPDGGSIKISTTEFPSFLRAVDQIPIRSLKTVPTNILKEQYKEFLERLEKLTGAYTSEQLKDLDPKYLIKKFFDQKENLFTNIEMIMQAIAVSCVKQSCKSVLESLVSQYENHFSSNRNIEEDHVNEEFFISVNGPNLAHCNSVIEEAMDKYWKQKDWHFLRMSLSDHLKDFDGDSKVLNRFFNEKSKFPFMEH